MKKIVFSILISLSNIALAQAPQKISYQAVARQASGAVISNAPIGVKFIIYQGSVGGTISYEETHNANTNQLGLFMLFIGGGSPSIGAFNTINWATGPYFIEIQIDPAGGTSYASIGTQQLMSVPYALFAEKAGNVSPTPTININAPNTIANPATGVYNISVPSYSAGTGISISSGIITSTASSITPTLVAGTNMIVNPTVASNSYTVSTPNYSLSTPSNTLLLLSNGINNSTAIIPTQLLSLSGSTLTSGVPTNSVNLAALSSLWTASGGTLYPTSATRIGIGTTTPNSPFQVANYISFESANGANTSLGFNTGTGISPNNFRNTFVGHAAGQAVGTGTASNNSYFGYNSGLLGNNVVNNSFFGSGTGANTTGSYNTFIGGYSGGTNTTGGNNLFLGYSSGFNNTSGNNNTFIGSGADLFSTTQRTNAAAIGYNAKVDTNNAIVLGSSGVNVGIGTTKPASSLHVTNNIGSQIRFGHNNQPTLEWYYDVDAVSHMSLKNENYGSFISVMDFDPIQGNVGIGNINPLNKLSVISSATNAALYIKSTSSSPISAQLIGDVIVSGKILTDSISISGPGTPTVGSVLVSRDNIGNAKWSGPVMFKATYTPTSIITVNAALITGIGGTAGYSSSTPINVGGGLSISPANMIFTAPQTGYYNLNATMLVSISPSASGNAYVYLELYNNTTATTIERAHSNNSDASSFYYTTLQVNTIAQLVQGQQVILRVGGSIANAGTITTNYSPNLINQFSGNLLR